MSSETDRPTVVDSRLPVVSPVLRVLALVRAGRDS